MTEAQERMYWRRWARVSAALHWRMVHGRLDPAAVLDGNEAIRAVVAAATARAMQQHCALTADDLRHGCHRVALRGRDKSHLEFSNREFDALLNLWGDEKTITGLLLESADLAAELHTLHPELKTRERQLHFLRTQCLPGYVASESQRIYGTKDFETLPAAQLSGLHDHLRARPHALLTAREGDPDWTV